MSIVSLILGIAVIGFVSWLVTQIPMLPLAKNIIIGVLCFVLILWVLQQFGIALPFTMKIH